MTADLPYDLDPAAVQLLQLLADATRRRIFLMLLRGETCNCELVAGLGLPHNLISHHLKRLRLAGLIRERRDRHADHWVHYVVDADALSGALHALTAALVPATTEARTPCCARNTSVPSGGGCPACMTGARSPASSGASRRRATRRPPAVTDVPPPAAAISAMCPDERSILSADLRRNHQPE